MDMWDGVSRVPREGSEEQIEAKSTVFVEMEKENSPGGAKEQKPNGQSNKRM